MTRAAIVAASRRVLQLHEDEAVVAWWVARARPLLAWLTPSRRRRLLALAALFLAVRRPLRELDPLLAVTTAAGALAGAANVLLLLGLLYALYVAAREFQALPGLVRRRPQLSLHSIYWALVALRWLVPDDGSVASRSFTALLLTLPFLIWRCGYMLMAGQRGRATSTRFRDHLFCLYPPWGGTNTPYGKGLDFLSRHEARTDEALARSQLAGLKLFVLAALWRGVLDVMPGIVHAKPGQPLSAYGLGVPRLDELLASGDHPGALLSWASIYVELVRDVLKLAARGHVIVGTLRLFGFHVFRNTYKPLLAPSVVEFWNRYYYYFKELLSDFFFFPTYVRRFRDRPQLRMFAAVFAAAGIGNLYYHLLGQDRSVLAADFPSLASWAQSRAFYCLLLSLGIYVSMRREQTRRGRTATAPSMLVALRRMAGVWTFFALIRIWGISSPASFGRRMDLFLSLVLLR